MKNIKVVNIYFFLRINKFIIKSYQALNNDNIKWKNRSELLAVTIGSKLQDGLTKKIAWDISTGIITYLIIRIK